MCEIGASIWFYYREICYDARSHERKKKIFYVCLVSGSSGKELLHSTHTIKYIPFTSTWVRRAEQ